MNKYYRLLFFSLTFIFFVVFFTTIHPLLPFDSDDWMFMSANRLAIPSPKYWNPSRVLPEVLMPVVSYIAAYVVYPFTGNYFGAQIGTHAIVVSFTITAYLYCFFHLLKTRFKVSSNHSLVYTLLFVLTHFIIMRTEDSGNQHLFYAHDLTCYYFYIIPNMLNSILVMSIICKDWIESNSFSAIKTGLYALIVYLAICSNLYCSDIFVIFLGCRMIMDFPWKKLSHTFAFVKENKIRIIIIVFWLFVNLLELIGPRSAFIAGDNGNVNIVEQIVITCKTFLSWKFNPLFLLLCFVVIGVNVFIVYKQRKFSKLAVHLLLTAMVTAIYIILVTSKVTPDYIERSDIMYSFLFPILMLLMMGVVNIGRVYKQMFYLLPFIMLLMFSHTNRSLSTFRDLGFNGTSGFDKIRELRNADEHILKQFIHADSTLQTDSLNIIVPLVTNDGRNWPYLLIFNNGYNSTTHTLYKHGLIRKPLPGKFIVGKCIDTY